jgi:hypothetical protein
MKKIIIIIFVFIWVSCSCTKESVEPDTASFIELAVDGGSTVRLNYSKNTNNGAYSNENCGKFFITASFDAPPFRFSLEVTKQGHIQKLMYTDFQLTKSYYEADFNILRAFQIKNFSYDEGKRNLYFEFEGYVYEHYYPEPRAKAKHLKGKVNFENMETVPCSFFPDEIAPTTPTPLLRINNRIAWTDGSTVQYRYFTDNGYMLVIHNPQKINEIPIGTYAYDNTKPTKITLHKYIGIVQTTILLPLKYEEWEHYDCEGNLNISQHNTTPFAHTAGSFNLRAKDMNGNMIYELPQVSFKIAPW